MWQPKHLKLVIVGFKQSSEIFDVQIAEFGFESSQNPPLM
jgi:hypothetical protein